MQIHVHITILVYSYLQYTVLYLFIFFKLLIYNLHYVYYSHISYHMIYLIISLKLSDTFFVQCTTSDETVLPTVVRTYISLIRTHAYRSYFSHTHTRILEHCTWRRDDLLYTLLILYTAFF